MEKWKVDLDRYLTREPSSHFYDDWCEKVVDNFSLAFWHSQENWIGEYDGQCNKWLSKLFNKGYDAKHAAKIIERTFNIFL